MEEEVLVGASQMRSLQELEKLYKSQVSPVIGEVSYLQFYHVVPILHLHIIEDNRWHWNIFFVAEELADVIEYVNTGRITRPELWTNNNILNKYHWSRAAHHIFMEYIRKKIDEDFGGYEVLEANERARISWNKKKRRKK